MEDTDQAGVNLRRYFEATLLSSNLALQIASRDAVRFGMVFAPKSEAEDGIVIRQGERAPAIQFLVGWMQKNLGNGIKICDPYFGPEELEVLRLIQETNPNCHVQILTSLSHQPIVGADETLQSLYDNYWRYRLSDQLPPDTDIVVVGINPRGGSPIHDRWWITESSGLRLGTSFNSIGVGKTSEISVISSELLSERETEIDQYLERRRRDSRGNELSYKLFRLMQ
jgi:hypothetical protein